MDGWMDGYVPRLRLVGLKDFTHILYLRASVIDWFPENINNIPARKK
jgi:hypothetical protein